jgi:LCP family protein required for cell wall assembly
VLLLGSDRRSSADPSWRTDAIIVVAIRPQARVVAMLSIPRDLWVTIPGYGQERINTADCLGEKESGPGGGPALVAAALSESLGIAVDAYARIDFAGLERVIDTLGGITVTSDRVFDEPMDEGDGGAEWRLRVAPGTQHMDGRTAVGYARSRRDTSDFDRSRRQQQILLAVRDAAMRPMVLPRVPALIRALSNAVDTDLSSDEVLSLAHLAARMEPTACRTRVFDGTMAHDWVTPEGAMVLLPNRARIEEVWAELTEAPTPSPAPAGP